MSVRMVLVFWVRQPIGDVVLCIPGPLLYCDVIVSQLYILIQKATSVIAPS